MSHSREIGGAEVYVQNLIQHLALKSDHAWQPELICRRDADMNAWAAVISEWAPVRRIDVSRPPDVLEMGRRMRGAQLVHLNLSYPSGRYPFAAAQLARGLGRRLIVTHHLGVKVGTPWRQLMGWLGRNAQQHIAVSHHTADALVATYGFPPHNVKVIHNGVDPALFRPGTPDWRSRLRHMAGEMLDGRPWGDDVLLICTVARLSRQKGLFELVEAASHVFAQSPRSRIVLIGEGEQRHRLVERIRELGLERQLFLTGALGRPLLAEWLAASDLFVLPSRYEGGPATALMEAMACGCAVVASDVSGVRELITDPSLGRLVPAQNPAALTTAILDLLSDAEQRATMGRQAREKVLAQFTIDACMRKTEAVLETAAG